MLVTTAAPTPPDYRGRLAQVLADFRIEGELLDWSATQGNLSRYRFAMAGAKKLKRARVLAPASPSRCT